MKKNLQDILYTSGLLKVVGEIDRDISEITMDSRKATSEALFIALKGTRVDAHQFIDSVVAQGVAAIVCEHLPEKIDPEVTYIKVKDSSKALGIIASNFYDRPSSKLNLIGVTGTNGKTTTVSLLFRLFISLGYKVGLLSTIENRINERVLTATHTTPDAISVNMLLNEMAEEGCEYVFMEVSSHAVHQNRIAGLEFKVAVFSNITHDHLDYHKTFKEYIAAKKKFFDDLSSTAYALVNADDKNGKLMLQNTQAKQRTYALKSMANFKAKVIENHFDGMLMEIDGIQFYSLLSGDFNAYNILAVYSTAILLDFNPTEVLEKLSSLSGAEGRFQIIRSPKKKAFAVVDYAHTPDALLNVLKTINALRTGN
ncbi:MAG: UDP-N-acetylmuramoyl-L-alanyl-D-glutamate--2,6-diaminopimelate ligase, partial [Marinilabiliales bacterium]